MIRGFFSETHLGSDDPAATKVPLVDAFLYLPCIEAHVTLQFLMDTGADVSVLHPPDGLRLVRRAKDWEIIRTYPAEYLGGAGGGHPYYGVPAVIMLSHEDGATDSLTAPIWIADPRGRQEHESLFGRDLLAHFVLTFAQPDALSLERK